MTGKVFADSHDIYQDQAKIAFDYYRAAAEKIVTEEIAIEKKIAEKNTLKATGNVLLQKKALNVKIAIGLLAVTAIAAVAGIVTASMYVLAVLPVLAIVFLIMKNSEKQKAEQAVRDVDKDIADLQQKHKDIFRDYRIEKLGIVYVPLAGRLPYENRSFLIDYTGTEPLTEFELQKVNDEERLNSTVEELGKLVSEAPIVETADDVTEVDSDNYSRSIQKVKYYDYFTSMDRHIRILGQTLQNISTIAVKLPVIKPQSAYTDMLATYATTDTADKPVVELFSTHAFDKEIDCFNELSNTRLALAENSLEFEHILRELIRKTAASVQVISKLKVASANKLVEDSNKLLFKMLKASYNHYSPELEADEIAKMRTEDFNYSEAVERYTPFQLKPSSRVRYNITSDIWVAEDGSKTTTPFCISQIQEEIVAPIVQNLLAESRMERLRIYNNIKDQKINYLNQWHQDTENFYGRNRTTSDDLKNLMRANLTKFLAAQTTLNSLESMKSGMLKKRKKEDEQLETDKGSSAQMLAAYEMQTKEFEKAQEDFENYMTRLKDDIDERAEDFAYIEYYDGSLRDRVAKDTISAADNAEALDARRKPLLAVNPLFAQVSEMPPTPDVEAVTNEHMSIDLNVIAEASLAELDRQEEQLRQAGS